MVKEDFGKIYIRSFGCPTNFADGEHMTSCLLAAHRNIVKKAVDADILIYNTCAVKTPTENKIIEILKKVPEGKKIVVTGCLPLVNFRRLKSEVKFDCALGSSPGNRIVNVVNMVEQGKKAVMLERDSKPTLNQSNTRLSRIISIVPINYGCLGSCAYCCVQFARGRLRSHLQDEIVKRVKHDLACGCQEIWLTSQDTACYGRDIDTDLGNLLQGVCKIDGTFFVRLGMMTPNYASEVLNALVEAYKDERIFKFLHLPVQSGDDEVLKLMNRGYSAEVFRRIISTFRKEIPNLTIATDIICGFPGESREAFKHSMDLLEEIQPDIVNISKFFVRPNTPAERMKPLPNEIVKERSQKMAKLVRQIMWTKNKVWINWEGKVLIDEKGKSPSSWIGRNFAYKPITVRSDENLLGTTMNVRISKAFPMHLEAERQN